MKKYLQNQLVRFLLVLCILSIVIFIIPRALIVGFDIVYDMYRESKIQYTAQPAGELHIGDNRILDSQIVYHEEMSRKGDSCAAQLFGHDDMYIYAVVSCITPGNQSSGAWDVRYKYSLEPFTIIETTPIGVDGGVNRVESFFPKEIIKISNISTENLLQEATNRANR